MKFKTIIFDFDGTLADTQSSILATVSATLQELNLPVPDGEAINQLIGLPLRDTFVKAAGVEDEKLIDRCVLLYRELFDDIAAKTVCLFPQVKETILTLRQWGIMVAVASSRGRDSLQSFLRMFGLQEHVSAVLGEQDVRHKKPAPDMVLHILEQTASLPQESLVVGDTTYDILMGQRAFCRTCAVTYGNHSRAQLKQQNPDFMIDDFSELLLIVK
ncbi:MAG: HAD family hydrolase [Muribaculaceae bacterium]|nr:HAD family hydrolase [Muribaculaceae bacterium]